MGKDQNLTSLRSILSDPKYRRKHLLVVQGKVFGVITGSNAVRLLDRVRKRYPRQTPTLIYVPGEESLILWF